MSEYYDFMKISNITRETIKKAKLGDAVYCIINVESDICGSCHQLKKTIAIRKLYVGTIREELDGGRRLELYKESPEYLKNSRHGMTAEFRPAAVTYFGGSSISFKKKDLLPELEHKLASTKELNEYIADKESKAE
jgi:hypothetical protein